MDISECETIMNVEDIKKVIPHRYPFLLIDRVIEFVDNERIVCIKNVTANEEFFQGHFPGRPIMPGVLILEAMAQAAAILAKKSTDGVAADKETFLVGANNVKWKHMVVPGDTLSLELVYRKKKGPLWILDGKASVGTRMMAMATISAVETT